jgi:hypothetical protein
LLLLLLGLLLQAAAAAAGLKLAAPAAAAVCGGSDACQSCVVLRVGVLMCRHQHPQRLTWGAV